MISRIPRQFHWVWLGKEPLPQKDQAWMLSWRRNHPSWRCIIWAEHPAQVALEGFETRALPPLVNQHLYDGIERWVRGKAVLAARSDIVRYEIVARYGGVYLDTDVECFRNIDELLQDVTLFVSDGWGGGECNYMFGAFANHPALWTTVRDLGPHLSACHHQLNPVQATGPDYLNPKLYLSQDLVIFPDQLFNPLDARDDPRWVRSWPQCSYGNHHFDGKWLEYTAWKNLPPPEFINARSIVKHGTSDAEWKEKGVR